MKHITHTPRREEIWGWMEGAEKGKDVTHYYLTLCRELFHLNTDIQYILHTCTGNTHTQVQRLYGIWCWSIVSHEYRRGINHCTPLNLMKSGYRVYSELGAWQKTEILNDVDLFGNTHAHTHTHTHTQIHTHTYTHAHTHRHTIHM